MRILLTNDDGIHAPGLAVLERIARGLADDVWVVAPEAEQSGASHSLTLHVPLRMRQAGERRFAVQGTPTDSVVMGVMHVLKDRRPDLVLSGVNRGANLADDVTYSGTVAGAMEGTVLGIPSIALSQGFNGPEGVPWETAERFGAPLIARLLKAGWPKDILLNVNFPPVMPEAVRGVAVTVQARRDESSIFIDERTDMRGNAYYWVGFRRGAEQALSGTDIEETRAGFVTVTPLHLDLTHGAAHADLARALAGAERA